MASGRIICGDAFSLLAHMEGRSWDAVITDPPEQVGPTIITQLLRVAKRVCIIEPLRTEWEVNPRPVPVYDPPRQQWAYWRVGFKDNIHFGQISFWRCPQIRTGMLVGECYEYDQRMLALHPGHKPAELFEDLLAYLDVQDVLDPFAGSGSVCAAAKRRGINFLGIELEQANARLCSAVLEGAL